MSMSSYLDRPLRSEAQARSDVVESVVASYACRQITEAAAMQQLQRLGFSQREAHARIQRAARNLDMAMEE